MASVELANDELRLLRHLLSYISNFELDNLTEDQRLVYEDRLALARQIDRKLERATADTWCRHCLERPRDYANGLCRRCKRYEAKYDRLPSEDTLLRSSRRSFERPPTRGKTGSRP